MMKNRNFWPALVFALTLSIVIYNIQSWQLILPIGFISGIIANGEKYGFLSSFCGILIGWFLLILVQSLNYPTIGASKLLAGIIGLSSSLWSLIIFLTIIMGGIIAGLSGLVGAYLGDALKEHLN